MVTFDALLLERFTREYVEARVRSSGEESVLLVERKTLKVPSRICRDFHSSSLQNHGVDE